MALGMQGEMIASMSCLTLFSCSGKRSPKHVSDYHVLPVATAKGFNIFL